MDLPRDEMAFRKCYQDLVVNELLTTVFRPGNRVFPSYRGYKPNEVVDARIIEKPGSDLENVAPVFSNIKVQIKIATIDVISIDSLRSMHFDGSSPDVQSVDQLLEHLEGIYNKPIDEFDHQVTRIQFDYCPVAQTVE